MPKPQGTPIGRKLSTTSKAVGSAFNAALAAQGGSLPIWLILSSIKGGPWSTQLDLARAVDIEGPTLTRHLDNLEQNGLVRRTRSEADRRAFRVELTPAGEAAHKAMLTAVITFNRRLLDGLSADEVGQLDELLTRLAHNVRPSG
jgi:MarR family transcriptional regulator for hemolysin